MEKKWTNKKTAGICYLPCQQGIRGSGRNPYKNRPLPQTATAILNKNNRLWSCALLRIMANTAREKHDMPTVNPEKAKRFIEHPIIDLSFTSQLTDSNDNYTEVYELIF